MVDDPVALMLVNARKSSRLTQAQVAERAGTTQSAVNRYENGIQTPSVDTLRRLLKANGLDLVLEVKKARKVGAKSDLFKLVQANRGEIRSILHSVGARNIRIVGSIARGDDDEYSDVDLLVSNPNKEGNWAIIKERAKVEKLLGVKVDLAIEELLISKTKKSMLRDAIPL